MTEGDLVPVGQPDALVERAVDAGMDAIVNALRDGGAGSLGVIIMLRAEGVADSEGDCTMAVQGIDDPEQVLEALALNAHQYAQAMGLRPPVAPIQPPG